MPRQTWSDERRAELERRWNAGEKPKAIRAAMNLSKGQLAGRVTKYNLHRPIERRRESAIGLDHWAVRSGRAIYPGQVSKPRMGHLRPGAYYTKLGKRIEKGPWRGMPVFALTLEERATCPRECALYVSCYGNHMQWAKRSPHGPEFEIELWRELHVLNRKHPAGFVVRLHVLGDFYSVSYVDLWEAALDHFPALHVFGYSARKNDEIGIAVKRLRDTRWARFAIRTSASRQTCGTVVIENVDDCPPGAIVCPAQTGKTRSCSTCGLCWHSQRPVAFVRH